MRKEYLAHSPDPLQRFDDYLTWVGAYTAWNAPYNATACREYSQLVMEEADCIARRFTAALTKALEGGE